MGTLPCRLAHPDEPAFQVDVVPVEAEELAAAQAGVGERASISRSRTRRPGLPLQDVVALGRLEQAGELAAVEHVGERLALPRRPQHEGRVALEVLVLDAEAEERLQRRHRARLASERGAEAEALPGLEVGDVADPLLVRRRGAEVALQRSRARSAACSSGMVVRRFSPRRTPSSPSAHMRRATRRRRPAGAAPSRSCAPGTRSGSRSGRRRSR
jgi:hypothetical protein